MVPRFLALLLLISLVATACTRPSLPETELPDDGPPIPVSEASAITFIQKSTTAAQGATNTGTITLTIRQEEVTSFIAIGSQLAEQMQELQNMENLEGISLEDLDQLEGLSGLEGIENLPEWQRLREERERLPNLPELRLPDLSLRLALKEPQVYFKESGHIIIRGYGEVRGRRQPLRIVTAPHASQGELVLDFVEGTLGPVPVPETLFDLVGEGIARTILAGQDFAEISELRVTEGQMTVSGRRNR